jgi:hypothetical protein
MAKNPAEIHRITQKNQGLPVRLFWNALNRTQKSELFSASLAISKPGLRSEVHHEISRRY